MESSTPKFDWLTFDSAIGRGDRLALPRNLVYVAAGLVALVLAWMALAHVDKVVRANGRIIPVDRAQVIQHLEGGIVTSIPVREGQLVRPGDDLITISDVQANSQVGERRVKLAALQAQVARLQAEAEGRAFVNTDKTLDPASVDRQMQVYGARQDKLRQTLNILREQLEQRRHELQEGESRSVGLTREQAIARQQLALTARMFDRQAASKLELLEAESRVERFDTQVREYGSSIPRMRAAVREVEGKIAETSAQHRSEARGQLADALVELGRITEEISSGNDRLSRTVVKSPVAGVINRIFPTTIGGVVRAGDPVMEITPVSGHLTIEATISPQDRAEVHAGLPAVIRITAYDFSAYGSLRGRVREVSADTISDERGERHFRVRIDIDPESYAAFGHDIAPGMNATADIVMGSRTILQYVISPMTRFLTTALRDKK